jgi:hypothetical protein
VSVFAPPWKVGVSPTTEPEGLAIVTLWPSGDAFVKLIVTEPGFAVSDVLSNFSCPSTLAARLIGCVLPTEVDGAGVDAAVLAGVELAVLAAVELEELLLEELPQPASATRPTANAATPGVEYLRARPAFCGLTVDPPFVVTIEDQPPLVILMICRPSSRSALTRTRRHRTT